MLKRMILIAVLCLAAYVLWIQFQILSQKGVFKIQKKEARTQETQKVYFFSFTKYKPTGGKEIEIEGDSANILAETVDLLNVVAKAYAEETPVTITADRGKYEKKTNVMHIEQNVVATTQDGTRMTTESLDIYPDKHILENDVQTIVRKNNINVDGIGARGDTNLKRVKFKKNVTVVVQPDKGSNEDPTVITCDGPLEIDYNQNIAYFKENVIAKDHRGTLYADLMDVYYSKESKKVSKIVARGNVMIENPDGNRTYSDSVIYLADEGRVILGGDTEALYAGGSRESFNQSGF
ncbi:MAG TPA: LPS export ABC transporter periplasmic protein LptC [Candidatus Omnitrophota bacterium]|nr:LPS export ABC transporter periplasmic protein LptC [Candidatus Omnitrophota bacterium]HRK62480.1 LPS export ABC transporter periplasmic protein LptC [Candidatus Omnitrophota bacterium]